jgi:hypothetical protein
MMALICLFKKCSELNKNTGSESSYFMLKFLRGTSTIFTIGISVTLFLAFVGKIKNEEVFFFDQKFPVVCWFKKTTGAECASCGLTRGWISVANGDFSKANIYNKYSIHTFTAAVVALVLFFYISIETKITALNYSVIFCISVIILVGAWYPIVKENIFLYDLYAVRIN